MESGLRKLALLTPVALCACSLLFAPGADLTGGEEPSAADGGPAREGGRPDGESEAATRPEQCETAGPARASRATGWPLATGALVASDGVVARGDESDGTLMVTGFGLQIPRDARITGIIVTSLSASDENGTMDRVAVLVGGVPSPSASRVPAAAYTRGAFPNLAPRTYGGGEELWGATWSPESLSSEAFGFQVQVKGLLPNVMVDEITIAVRYCRSASTDS